MSDSDFLGYANAISTGIANLSNTISADKAAKKQESLWEDQMEMNQSQFDTRLQTAWDMFHQSNDFSAAEAKKQRDYLENMYSYYQSPQAMVRQYIEAGLNPAAIGQTNGNFGGASVGSAAHGELPAPSPSAPMPQAYFAPVDSPSQLAGGMLSSIDGSFRAEQNSMNLRTAERQLRNLEKEGVSKDLLNSYQSLVNDLRENTLGNSVIASYLENEQLKQRIALMHQQELDYASQIMTRDLAAHLDVQRDSREWIKLNEYVRQFNESLSARYAELREAARANDINETDVKNKCDNFVRELNERVRQFDELSTYHKWQLGASAFRDILIGVSQANGVIQSWLPTGKVMKLIDKVSGSKNAKETEGAIHELVPEVSKGYKPDFSSPTTPDAIRWPNLYNISH